MTRFSSDAPHNLERDPVPHPDPPVEPVVLEVVQVDTLIERADLAPGSYTLIAAGDVVPLKLADLPRQPASGPPKRARRAARKV